MDFLEKILAWLRGFPGLESLAVEQVGAKPGNCALFPLGLQELSRKQDVVGNTVTLCCQSFLLRRNGLRQAAAAGWLLELQDWVRQQSLAGLAPRFGLDSSVRAEKGKLAQASQTGIGAYEVKIIFTFKEKCYGEN